ncbi:hypothetical protein [Carboxydothermus ferrireducens]|uniref:Uncharacterized protein n=1 Tax=Carboxydothermus ferrireducens DSM 11255 TaxID=1119529 RepID=A0ABX2R9B7_9THEO|nr:hypothetical protein [Carboxydothermus ferrireducens]NYE57142.1 hypothetical protein [Carboxydothermus ferrireducens DSM 11255]
MEVILCGSPVSGATPAFIARTPVEAYDLLKERGEGVVLVSFSDRQGIEFALNASRLYRDKKFLLVLEKADLKTWIELERAGVTPVHPTDIEQVLKNLKFKARTPVPVEAAVEEEKKTLKEQLGKPVSAVYAGKVAVTSLKPGAGKSFLARELAEEFRKATGLPVYINEEGQGLCFFEEDFDPELGSRYDSVLVVSRADEISLARLSNLKGLYEFKNFYLVLNQSEKIRILAEALPFPLAAVVPPKESKNYERELKKILSLVTGSDFLFEKKRSFWEVIGWKRRNAQQV